MQPDVDGFLARFFAFGAAPAVETYLPLFHPDATLFDSGMERPIAVPEIPEHIETILKLVPDFCMVPQRWRERAGTLFVEAHNRATVGTTPMQWCSVYCVDLEGDRVIRGRRYYDRRPLFAILNPALPSLPDAAANRAPAQAGPEPDAESFVRALVQHGAAGRDPLTALLPDLALELQQWAGDEELVFVEWTACATVAGEPFRFGIADRFERTDGRVRDACAYFDTLALATRLVGEGRVPD